MKTSKKVIVFILINAIVLALLTFLLNAPSCTKLLMGDAETGDYDTLIMGQSHAYAGYNPFIISDQLDCETIDIARPSTSTYNEYYMLQEVNKTKKYKTLIFDIDYSYWDRGHSGRAGSDANLLLRLTGKRWLSYYKDVMLDSNYNDSIADYKLSGLGVIKNLPRNIKIKTSKGYQDNDPSLFETVGGFTEDGYYHYGGRGFYEGVNYMEDYYFKPLLFGDGSINEENDLVLKKMASYCKENDIRMICVSSALPPKRLKEEDIDQFHQYFAALCDSIGVPFYDMNYAKKMDRTGADYIDKKGHMMLSLANRQTDLLCEILKSDSPEEYFFDSYSEVLKNLEGCVS